MRVMVIVKGNEDFENGRLGSAEEFARMGRFNEELVEAGIMLAGEGLQPSSKGKRVRFGTHTTVLDGPFAEAKELVGGFWIWQVSSMDEAIEWAKRAPFPEDGELELRKIMDAEDFGDGFTAEVQAAEQKVRAGLTARDIPARDIPARDIPARDIPARDMAEADER